MDKRQLRKYRREVRKAETRVSKKIIDRMIEIKGEDNIQDINLGDMTEEDRVMLDKVIGVLNRVDVEKWG